MKSDNLIGCNDVSTIKTVQIPTKTACLLEVPVKSFLSEANKNDFNGTKNKLTGRKKGQTKE